jgi:nicotinamide-nucleotide adenylyltransferase
MAGARGLLIGRFQPFHLGHLALIRQLREHRPTETLLLGIGSAQVAYTIENPFTAGERYEMIEAALEEALLKGCRPVPVTDVDRHAIWVAHVESMLPTFTTVYTNNPLTRALFERAGHPVVEPGLIERERFEGVRVRQALADDRGWRELVPPSVAHLLEDLGGPERLRLLSAGHPRLARESRR